MHVCESVSVRVCMRARAISLLSRPLSPTNTILDDQKIGAFHRTVPHTRQQKACDGVLVPNHSHQLAVLVRHSIGVPAR